jgi:hypothetical protein
MNSSKIISLYPLSAFKSRLQKVETRNLQMAGTGERLMISNGYNHHNARSPVPVYFLQATLSASIFSQIQIHS